MMIVRGGRWRFFGRAAKNNCGSSSCCWAAAAVAIQGGKATDLVGDGAKKEEQLPLHNTCYGRCVCFLRSRKSPSPLSSIPLQQESLWVGAHRVYFKD